MFCEFSRPKCRDCYFLTVQKVEKFNKKIKFESTPKSKFVPMCPKRDFSNVLFFNHFPLGVGAKNDWKATKLSFRSGLKIQVSLMIRLRNWGGIKVKWLMVKIVILRNDILLLRIWNWVFNEFKNLIWF